jgi:hypothetical protein
MTDGLNRRAARPVACGATLLMLLAVCAGLLSGCVSIGPVGVDPDRSFTGLRDVLADVGDGGAVDIFLVHGMRADKTQTYADVIPGVAKRLALVPATTDSTVMLVPTAPTITLDGVPVFSRDNWNGFRPRVTVERYHTATGNKQVNFYRFEYWEALALMKCRLIIAEDTRVVGASARSGFCAQDPYLAPGGARLSSNSDYGNRLLKTEIMEWGLADAMIATSAYRTVLHQAVREMFALAVREARGRDGRPVDQPGVDAVTELGQLASSNRTRFAFISESLGSYVVHDALAQSTAQTGAALAERAALQPDANARAVEAIAPMVVICGASQVHMFANQLALLRFSELQVLGMDGMDVGGTAQQLPDDPTPGRAHFFRGCPPPAALTQSASTPARFGAQQVVAYHEPNDLLTYYTSDRPGNVGTGNLNTTNVVVPYTTQWIWFLAADPITAHTGQPEQAVIMDMVACGRAAGQRPSCTH